MEKITLTINGKNISCLPGTTVLEAAEQNGIKIPRLCYHPELEPAGACRLCLVEDEKRGRLMASCVAPATQGMLIRTDSPRINNHRRNIIRLMMAEHPESCIVCSKGNRCQLRQIAGELGVGDTGLYPMSHFSALEEANPFIIRDLSKCILCGRCIKADQELVVVGAIDYNLRGFKSRPATLHELPLEESTCTFCGTCISICPTGALMAKNTQYVGTPQREASTICGFCGVGCTLVMGTTDGRVVEVNPSSSKDSVNRSTLCVRGHFAHDFLNTKERLGQPLIRKDDGLTPVSWDEALDRVADRLASIKKDFGPLSIGFLGSSKCSNEENYLFGKIARVIMETNNVDNGGYLAGRSVLGLLDESTAGGWRPKPLSSLEKADAIVVLGADPSQALPVAGYHIKRAAKKGAPLIVIDPRKTDLIPFSSAWLAAWPDKDLEIIMCLSALIWKRFSHDANFMERFTENVTEYTDALSSFNPERLCVEAGTDMRLLEKSVELLAGKKIAFVVGNGILQQKNGAPAMKAIVNLSLLTGSLGSEHGGIVVLNKENNQMGADDMGTVPGRLPGGCAVKNNAERMVWERNWQTKLSPDPGLDMMGMIQEAEKGNLKALFIMGENPVRSCPQPERVTKALSNLDFLVVQDILDSETAGIAHVVLPGAAFSEKGGSFTNMEGRIQSFEPVVPPPAGAKPDWEILDLLYRNMSPLEGYSSLEKIREEIRQWVPLYGQLGKNGKTSWIHHTHTMRLFNHDGEGGRIPFSYPTRRADKKSYDGYAYQAILGSRRYHLGSGTRTAHSARIGQFDIKGDIEISPMDGAELGLKDGDRVRVSSPFGSIERQVEMNMSLGKGIIFVPLAFDHNAAMQLIELTHLNDAGLKACPVKIEKR